MYTESNERFSAPNLLLSGRLRNPLKPLPVGGHRKGNHAKQQTRLKNKPESSQGAI